MSRSNFFASLDLHRVGVVDAVDLGALEDHLGLDLHGPQGGRGVGGEVRVAGPAGEDHHALLLHVADGAAADERLRHLAHLDGGEHAGLHLGPLQGVLEGEGVDDGGQHPHVVGGDAVHPRRGVGHAAEDVAAADHHPDLHAQGGDALDLHRQVVGEVAVDAEGLLAEQRLARELQQDPAEGRLLGARHAFVLQRWPRPKGRGGDVTTPRAGLGSPRRP